MKNLFWLPILYFLILTGCKDNKFKESEFERGAKFVADWHYKYKEYPSWMAREKAYMYPSLTIDSIYKLQTGVSDMVKYYLDTLVPGIHRFLPHKDTLPNQPIRSEIK